MRLVCGILFATLFLAVSSYRTSTPPPSGRSVPCSIRSAWCSSGYTTHSDGGTLGTAFRRAGLRPGAAVFHGDAALAGASSLPVRHHQAARGHGGSGGPQFGGRRHGAGQPRGHAYRRSVSFLVFWHAAWRARGGEPAIVLGRPREARGGHGRADLAARRAAGCGGERG